MNIGTKNIKFESDKIEKLLNALLKEGTISQEEYDNEMSLLKFSQEQLIMFNLLEDFRNFLIAEHTRTISPISNPKLYEKQRKDYESKKKHESQ